MLFWITLRSAIKSLWANKLRSFLAMLGIIIGVGAVIAMIAMGAGAQKQVVSQIEAMGTNLLIVQPQYKRDAGVTSGTMQKLTLDDAMAIAQLPGVKEVAPVVSSSTQVKYEGQNSPESIQGTSPDYLEIRNFEIDKGRMFTEEEADGLARVAVMGPLAVENLFNGQDPLGKEIKIKGINFTVVGVTKSKGGQGWFNPDDEIFVPYSTAMKILFGLDYVKEIDVLAKEGVNLTTLSGQPPGQGYGPPRDFNPDEQQPPPPPDSVTALLRKRHRIQTDQIDDFRIQNQDDIIATRTAFIWTFRVLLFSIASISLLVGGIGIMNIMLVTVTERTREIGTRKAIGAKNRDILTQFLIEAMAMSGLGGALGAAAGIGLAKIIPMIPMFSTFMTIVQPTVVIVSILFAAVVGIFFGLYPAYRASQLDPIDALRYE
ncbi:MAG TPA: ABC transporter permease [Phycisphaerae bacterium]|nr:ABC transporter permease [Phycisphaerae bacterium]